MICDDLDVYVCGGGGEEGIVKVFCLDGVWDGVVGYLIVEDCKSLLGWGRGRETEV